MLKNEPYMTRYDITGGQRGVVAQRVGSRTCDQEIAGLTCGRGAARVTTLERYAKFTLGHQICHQLIGRTRVSVDTV